MTALTPLRQRFQVFLWALVGVVIFVLPTALPYDGYDGEVVYGCGETAVAYDATAVLGKAGEDTGGPEGRVIFARLDEFLATEMTPSLDALSQAAGAADRGGFTVAGTSLTKHGASASPGNTLFPAAKGNPASIRQSAQNLVDDIHTTPGSTIQNSTRPDSEPWRIGYQDALSALGEAKRRLVGE